MSFSKYLTYLKEDYNEYKKIKQFSNALSNISFPQPASTNDSDIVHFKHSGHLGDIIYAIPAMKILAKGKKIALHLNLNEVSQLRKKMQHPNGSKMLTEKSVALLESLFLAQDNFVSCDILTNQQIDFDLDLVRSYPFDYRMGSIPRWYFLTFGITCDLSQPWLKVTPNTDLNGYILIARSKRYRTPGIDYSFINKYPKIGFVGMEDEYNDMKQSIKNIEYFPVKDYLEMASYIAGANFFIGNQSSPFSLAEALKVKRALEVYPLIPNVVVEGANGYDFCYQPQFEKIVEELVRQSD